MTDDDRWEQCIRLVQACVRFGWGVEDIAVHIRKTHGINVTVDEVKSVVWEDMKKGARHEQT